ncbi:oligosaccharide repeat unit polymerase Wzy [Limosilactobacillus frumenti DSM 13145]|uniref:Oligosaccharide repeat unit polymerase Wzy n=1 Tax=Limosilactobacillus frumenti DSM 13145 TaxID=1423746 RepID=A0A0R1P0Z4_9LACO|nr:hypothetical protein [Limosilactobacillus frumenti]KRL26174.1 oligosaccharide repeat unit polymerase Wzy [Limosilactobacillus frumenti DSM 13145]MBA2914617.1 hypothetical protein [Limosilactobacillus frumenti]QFG72968.1 hypothetical protein LF145_06395 [Limosilactobacillus frumenti]
MLGQVKKIENWPLDGSRIYEVAFSIYFIITFFLTSTYTDYIPSHSLHELSFIPLVMVLFKIIILDFNEHKRWCINILLLALLVICWRKSGEFILFPMGIFVLGAHGVSMRRIIYLYFVLGTVMLSFAFFTSLLGLTKNLIFYRGGSHSIRQSFGIIYPTDFAAHVLFLVLAYCYLHFGRIGWVDNIAFLALAVGVERFCDARLGAGAIILTVPIIWIGQLARQHHLWARTIAIFYWILPIIAGYITVLTAYLYHPNNASMEKLNSLLSGRLYFGHLAFIKYHLTLFGQKVVENGFGGNAGHHLANSNDSSSYFYIDSSFLRIIILYGIIMFILILLALSAISWLSIRQEDFALASILVIVTISAVVEQRLIDITYNPFLLALFAQCYYQIKNKIGETS